MHKSESNSSKLYEKTDNDMSSVNTDIVTINRNIEKSRTFSESTCSSVSTIDDKTERLIVFDSSDNMIEKNTHFIQREFNYTQIRNTHTPTNLYDYLKENETPPYKNVKLFLPENK